MAHADAQLSELATQMKSTIQEHFVPTLEEMKQKFDTSLHDIDNWVEDIHDALEEVRDQLSAKVTLVAHAWADQTKNIKDNFGLAVESGQAYKEEVHQAEESVHTLHATTSGHSAELHGGLGAAQELGHKVQDEIGHHLTDWTGVIEHTLSQADEHASHIEQNLAHLGGEMAHGLADVVGQIGHAASSVTEHVSKSLDEFGNHLDQMNGDQHEHLLDQVGEAIGGNVGGVISVVGEFMHAGEEMHQLFDGSLGHILDSVKDVDKVIHEIKPVIDLAETLL